MDTMSALPAFIIGLIEELPEPGTVWRAEDQAAWFRACGAIFDLIYLEPDIPVPPEAAAAYEAGWNAACEGIRDCVKDVWHTAGEMSEGMLEIPVAHGGTTPPVPRIEQRHPNPASARPVDTAAPPPELLSVEGDGARSGEGRAEPPAPGGARGANVSAGVTSPGGEQPGTDAAQGRYPGRQGQRLTAKAKARATDSDLAPRRCAGCQKVFPARGDAKFCADCTRFDPAAKPAADAAAPAPNAKPSRAEHLLAWLTAQADAGVGLPRTRTRCAEAAGMPAGSSGHFNHLAAAGRIELLSEADRWGVRLADGRELWSPAEDDDAAIGEAPAGRVYADDRLSR